MTFNPFYIYFFVCGKLLLHFDVSTAFGNFISFRMDIHLNIIDRIIELRGMSTSVSFYLFTRLVRIVSLSSVLISLMSNHRMKRKTIHNTWRPSSIGPEAHLLVVQLRINTQ